MGYMSDYHKTDFNFDILIKYDWYNKFPLFPLLIQEYKGKIAIAGGSIIRCFIDSLDDDRIRYVNTMDIDIFFYNTNEYWRIFVESKEANMFQILLSILGGFDIPPSMFIYDGNELYGTRLGVWSLIKGASFLARIHKYMNLKFSPIVLGIRESNIRSHFKQLIEDKKKNLSKTFK